MRTVLVTGGSGFIGTHVVAELENRGYWPTIFDRHRSEQQHVFLGDVRDPVAVDEAVSQHDATIHLAGVLGTQETIENPQPAVETNITGSLNVFQACRRHRRKCVYIAVGNHWMNNSYSITKTTAERFALMFNQEFGTDISVVRGLNAYGPGQKAGPVRKIIPNFIIPALKDEPLLIYGNGNQRMDMIYVADLAAILVNAMETPWDSLNPIIDGGTGYADRVRSIAETVMGRVGRGRIKYAPMRPGEPDESVVVADLGTLPWQIDFTSLADGIDKSVPFYESLLQLQP
jgi:UDP-glucose 4-epimerase